MRTLSKDSRPGATNYSEEGQCPDPEAETEQSGPQPRSDVLHGKLLLPHGQDGGLHGLLLRLAQLVLAAVPAVPGPAVPLRRVLCSVSSVLPVLRRTARDCRTCTSCSPGLWNLLNPSGISPSSNYFTAIDLKPKIPGTYDLQTRIALISLSG